MPLSLRRGAVTAIAERHPGLVHCEVEGQPCVAYPELTGLGVAYVQVPGGAPPIGLSDTVRALRAGDLLAATVSAGACFGGEVESVTTASALAWAAADGFDVVVCAIGPGIVGTASRLGHG